MCLLVIVEKINILNESSRYNIPFYSTNSIEVHVKKKYILLFERYIGKLKISKKNVYIFQLPCRNRIGKINIKHNVSKYNLERSDFFLFAQNMHTEKLHFSFEEDIKICKKKTYFNFRRILSYVIYILIRVTRAFAFL